jgi:pimeloyl-ACP methyl ester carboxylesterase
VQTQEVQALGKLGGQAISVPVRTARDLEGAVTQRVFGALGRFALPVEVAHRAISRTVFKSVDVALRAPLVAGGAALADTTAPRGGRVGDTVPGALALGVLNGMWGDSIARDHPALAYDLHVRCHGRAVATDSEALAEAFPDATPRLCVFVHGLCETEEAWRGGYGRRLREDLDYTPVYVRFNSGLHVSDNGRRLAATLEEVVRGWPVGVDEVALIGHSMGGLVARSACHYGNHDDHAWTERLRHVFCLGSPHLGAPLERGANAVGWALSRLPEAKPFADWINVRSAGVKDMRYGNCVEEDWCDCDPDELLRDRCLEVPFLPTANYYFVGATLARDPDSTAGRLVGDLLVQFASASGNGPKRRIPFEVDNGVHIGGIHHLQLLNHPAVYEQLHKWLSASPRQLAAGATAPEELAR